MACWVEIALGLEQTNFSTYVEEIDVKAKLETLSQNIQTGGT
jgi:hypothetical protein